MSYIKIPDYICIQLENIMKENSTFLYYYKYITINNDGRKLYVLRSLLNNKCCSSLSTLLVTCAVVILLRLHVHVKRHLTAILNCTSLV